MTGRTRRIWNRAYELLTNNVAVNFVAGIIRVIKAIAKVIKNRPRRALTKRDTPLTVKDLWSRYLKENPRLKWTLALLMVMWAGWIPGVFIFPDNKPYNAAADARGNLVQMFELEATPPAERPKVRKKLADALLNLQEAGIGNKMNDAAQGELKDVVIGKVRQTRETGQPLQLDSSHRGLSSSVEIPLSYLAVLPFATITLLGWRYLDRCKLQAERAIDLPWKRGWPFVFVALCFWVLVPAMLVSLARQYRASKRTSKADAAKEVKEQTYTFNHDPDAARKLYFELRSGKWQDYVRDRLAQIEQDIKLLVQNILREQAQRNALMGEQERLQGVEASHDPATTEELTEEFDYILKHEAVHGIAVDGSDLLILVKARFALNGVTYDLGDWEVRISRTGFRTRELRTGTKVDWHFWAHPIYRLPDGQFCFGATAVEISLKIARNQLAQAAVLAADSLCAINAKDYQHVPVAFKVVSE